MVNEVANYDIPLILSETAQIAYNKIKTLILKIFYLLKRHINQIEIKEEFENAYLEFARKLKEEGHDNEYRFYMSIGGMYCDLMDRPDVLMEHESFFMDLYDGFDELLYIKLEKPDEYDVKFREFLIYWGKMQEYYYTQLAIPSEYYDEDVLNEIISKLVGGYND